MRPVLLLALFTAALSAQSTAVSAALATGTYFPLDVGDRWVYRIDDRAVTASYQTWRVDRLDIRSGGTYSVMAIEGPGSAYSEFWFRADASGKVYLLSGTGEQVFLDPSGQSPGAPLQITGKASSYVAPLGAFQDTLSYSNLLNILTFERGVLARGVGLLTSQSNLETGSSGGFWQGRTLVEASLAGGAIRLPAPVPSVQLGIESLSLDVTGKKVTNCVVPCYFAACSIAPGTDPPGTYKPCAQARVGLANWPEGASRSVRLQLVSSNGTAAFDQTLTLDASPTEAVTFLQVPLYSAPNQPLPAGAYQLTAKSGDGVAQAALAVQIQ